MDRIEAMLALLFQYPLADRRACGLVLVRSAKERLGFSILLRIVELAERIFPVTT